MPPKRDKDSEYEPSSEEVEEDDESEEEELEETGTEPKKKSKKSTKTKKTNKKVIDKYKPSDSESEEYIDDTAEQSSSQKGKKKKKSTKEKKPDDDDDDDKEKSTLKDKTKKVAQKLKDKKDEILDQGKLSPPVIKSPNKKISGNITNTEGDIGGSSEYDDLLSGFPLPSHSRPQVFNKNISMIGSLNIQAFGTKKSSNKIIMRIIADILRHYGIILCQEIRANEDIIQELVNEVSTPATPYAYVASHPIGRSTYQERYVFLYRSNEWKVLEDYVIDDDDKLGDKFIREPYVARFQHLERKNVRITLVGCHTRPDNAFEEINTLVNTVYMDVRKKLQRDNVQEKRQLDKETGPKEPNTFISFLQRIFCCCCGGYSHVSTRDFSEELAPSGADTNEPIIMMGDLNAAGSYVNKSQRAELDTILKKNNLRWGIQDNMDTTVADGPDTAYDRFIFEAANERRWIGNTKVWRFDDGWLNGKTDNETVKKAAKRVTDHYPIEFELKLKV
ncbi:hypothetical protein RirG_055820 [Rhizophagus irregularis DAOM 197198w]|uniref:DNase I-like protein n=1 Tax=Rhizophagus irregularis (strain DAOM 197198w) TaxID=1432141 RepID=A0A015JWK7_RHIIW|nr:hypothetical protein RirG_055820 [Rhizophagus irregularis DAOM 197198w]